MVPKPLPYNRRALSATRPHSGLGDLCKFPYEIRRMIFIYVLGDQVIHIDNPGHMPNRLSHIRCCEFSQLLHNPRDEELHTSGNGKMGLLKSSHAIYIEAVGLLYATNSFALYGQARQVEAFLYFCESIRPCRLASISDLQLSYVELLESDLHFLACWNRLWDTIARRMTGLKRLTLHLGLRSRLPLLLAEDWVKPMLQVRGVKKLNFKLHGFIGRLADDYDTEILLFKERLEEQMFRERGPIQNQDIYIIGATEVDMGTKSPVSSCGVVDRTAERAAMQI